MKRKLTCTCTNYFIILEKKIQDNTPKIQMLMFGLAQTSHFGLWDIIPPSGKLPPWGNELIFKVSQYDMFSTFTVKLLQLLVLTFTSSSSQRSNIALIACGASVGKYLKNLAINCEASLFSPGPPLTAPMM